MDITQLILDDHAEQRRLFSIIEQIDPKDTDALSAVWSRLSAFLDVHAEAEERFFYPELLKQGELRSFKVGARVLIPDADLVNFVAKRLEAAA